MENYSLSDIASVANDNGFGGSGMWIFALLLLIFGMNGFGGANRSAADFGTFASAASQSEILLGQQFNALDNKIDRIGNGIADLGYAMQGNLNNVQSTLGAAINAEGRDIDNKLCAINNNIDNKFAALEKSQLEQKINDQAAQIAALQTQQMICGIPKVSPYGYQPVWACGCNGNNI